ncbi:Capsule biosynthesis protein CapC [Posidoniimonas polymericola]|uniref:Capsule biosynthesis protein CapC n=1 Tax=Posidoniimonas polymericola TaxID=2528002 RepID=A0A5C5YTT4_9BACT|nr:poly-gamma-glutamate biosynthesis protein PgsC [Posidoniimonas polymericola]TWT78166.1 Capsule biosynthesis protein CapC [Posidoniimonas polymericola]
MIDVDIVAVSIGVGLAVSLMFSEVFGLAAGGMVVPGYFALYLGKPIDVLLTLACALATFLVVRLLSTFVIIYGKRRTVMMILVGFLLNSVFSLLPVEELLIKAGYTPDLENGSAMEVIGYIIPGLVAIWIDRQGLVETLSALTSASIVVRLILILIFGMSLNQL